MSVRIPNPNGPLLSISPVLASPLFDKHVDASDVGAGAVLSQDVNMGGRSICWFSSLCRSVYQVNYFDTNKKTTLGERWCSSHSAYKPNPRTFFAVVTEP